MFSFKQLQKRVLAARIVPSQFRKLTKDVYALYIFLTKFTRAYL